MLQLRMVVCRFVELRFKNVVNLDFKNSSMKKLEYLWCIRFLSSVGLKLKLSKIFKIKPRITPLPEKTMSLEIISYYSKMFGNVLVWYNISSFFRLNPIKFLWLSAGRDFHKFLYIYVRLRKHITPFKFHWSQFDYGYYTSTGFLAL